MKILKALEKSGAFWLGNQNLQFRNPQEVV